ncbi:MAG: hypothetical protein AAGG68_08295 [Bacteroidota bacterium]
MLVGLYFAIQPYFSGMEQLKDNPNVIFESINSMLIFMGLGISFSSLQDTTKTQNELSKKIWENPRKGKMMIVLMSVMILFTLVLGLVGYFLAGDGILKDIAIGTIVLGLGMFGFLKAAIEMFENHRKDKDSAFSSAVQQ